MAEGNEELPGGSWWGSWYSSAKTKTSTVFEAVKKDLDELSSAVKNEASNVGAAIESTLKFDDENSTVVGNVKKSLSTFLNQVSEALVPSLEDDEVEAVLITNDGTVTLTGFQKHLADLQKNDKTYLEEPQDELVEKYKRWMEVVEQDQFTQNRLARHLASSEILNEKYLSLVPEKTPHMEFWQRYLFKRALLEDALANAEMAERRAKIEIDSTNPVSPRKNIIQTEQPKLACAENEKVDEVSTPVKENPKLIEEDLTEDDINWESEEIPCNVELTEEEQTRLLEQYEQEIQEREKRKSLILSDDIVINETNKTTAKPSPENQAPQNKKSTKKIQKQATPSTESKKKQPQNKNSTKQQATLSTSKSNSNPENNKTLSVEKDHFDHKEESLSSASDESWEKDFDINE